MQKWSVVLSFPDFRRPIYKIAKQIALNYQGMVINFKLSFSKTLFENQGKRLLYISFSIRKTIF